MTKSPQLLLQSTTSHISTFDTCYNPGDTMGTISTGVSPEEGQKLSMILWDIKKHIPNRSLRESIQLLEILAMQRFHLVAQAVLTECFEIILDSAMLPEVAKISHLSRVYRAAVLDYLRRRVDGLLRTWFTDPACFRDILRSTSSMVSGSTALTFALGMDWGVQDLDIYVGSAAGRRARLLRHLVEVEGYRPQAAFGDAFDPTFSKISSTAFTGSSYPHNGGIIEAVYKLTKTRTITGQKEPITAHIEVIECEHTNPIQVMSEFHSTQVMNWISADNITITFPVLTFAMRGVTNQNRITTDWPKDKSWKEKYVARGFKIFDAHSSLDIPCGTSCAVISRSSYDIGCMRMPYGQGSVVDQFEAINWKPIRRSRRLCFEASKLPLSRPLRRFPGTGQPESRDEERGGGGSQPRTIRGGRGQPNHQLQNRGGAGGGGKGQLETSLRGRGGRAQPSDQPQNPGGAGRGETTQQQARGAEGRGGRTRSRRRGGRRGRPST